MDTAASSTQVSDLSPDTEVFRSLVLQAVGRTLAHAVEVLGEQDAFNRFGFLRDYAEILNELGEPEPNATFAHRALSALTESEQWPRHTAEVWIACGLVEEDARFAEVFRTFDPRALSLRPCLGLMQAWWGTLPRTGIRPALRALLECGLLRVCTPEAANAEQLFEVEENCWAAARGEPPTRPIEGVRLAQLTDAPALDHFVWPERIRTRIDELSQRIAEGQFEAGGTLIVRGPPHNGRRSVFEAIARSEGKNTLHIRWPLPEGERGAPAPAWLGAFATLTGARPILHVRGNPGDSIGLPPLRGYRGWIGVVASDDDAFEEPPSPVWSVHLPLPEAAIRCALIRRGSPALPHAEAEELAEQLQLSSGNLVRALGSQPVHLGSIAERAARVRTLALAGGSAALDSLARRLECDGDWQQLVLDADLHRDLQALEARCMQRERVRGALPGPFAGRLNSGVRALFAGPSGTGKTLAAQVLAARLGRPLYRLDLSSVVSKYIGETERNLQRLLSAAEALDVMLLLDEGDALLAKRTDVSNANDRYANLETNFLLQRLETHRGLVVVTTNALQRIDSAFLRRFDHLLNFRAPDARERGALWRAHLPAEHSATERCLADVVETCVLSGAQIRNVVLSAVSAALAHNRGVDDALLLDALRREYRRSGTLCPLGRN